MNREPGAVLPSLAGMIRVSVQVALYLGLFLAVYLGLFTVPVVLVLGLALVYVAYRAYRHYARP